MHGVEVLTRDLTVHGYDPGYWVARTVRAMGSDAHLIVGDAPPGVTDWALAELERLEQCWSRFRPSSELSELNASPGRAVRVSPTLCAALERCDRLWHATSGLFDPTVLDALEGLGYDRSFESIDRADAAIVRASVPGWARVDVDSSERTVRMPVGTRIDLGGVGKGLAADLIAEGLVDRGAASACVALGGDVRITGTAPDHAGWTVPVEDPVTGVRAFETRVTSGGLAMSTTLIRRWHRGGREVHHIIDPFEGLPSHTGLVSTVVAADTAWWAEGLAKAAILAGPRRSLALLRRFEVSAWLEFEDGTSSTIGDWKPTTC